MCLAIPGKLIEKTEHDGTLVGKVAFGGIIRQASLDFLPEAEVGDYVLVHVGFAISRVDEEEARTTFAYMQQVGMLEEELGAQPEDAPSSFSPKLFENTNAPQMASFAAPSKTDSSKTEETK
jgi:hydrogenase expression/formation protein HypC